MTQEITIRSPRYKVGEFAYYFNNGTLHKLRVDQVILSGTSNSTEDPVAQYSYILWGFTEPVSENVLFKTKDDIIAWIRSMVFMNSMDIKK